ncbi:MAG: hypothetical protein M1296_01790 [Chloroflexi bacterium]|nr:hypothetical protein [Chloroflexota bacterium]
MQAVNEESARCEFSLAHYRYILRRARAAGYHVCGHREFLRSSAQRTLMLRHDVDVSLAEALRLARLEAREGVQSTYFIRLRASGYNVLSRLELTRIRTLIDLGFEVGLHLETGLREGLFIDPSEEAAFSKQLLEIVSGQAVAGCAMHVPKQTHGSLSRDTLRKSGFLYEAGEPEFNHHVQFFSDSNQMWKPSCPCLAIDQADRLYVTVHPIWWTRPRTNVERIRRRLSQGL